MNQSGIVLVQGLVRNKFFEASIFILNVFWSVFFHVFIYLFLSKLYNTIVSTVRWVIITLSTK